MIAIENTERKDGESFVRYMKRIVAMAADKRISYTEMNDALFGNDNVYSEDNSRKMFYGFEKLCKRLEDGVNISQRPCYRGLRRPSLADNGDEVFPRSRYMGRFHYRVGTRKHLRQ